MDRTTEILELKEQMSADPRVREHPSYPLHFSTWARCLLAAGHREKAERILKAAYRWYDSRPASERETESYRFHLGMCRYYSGDLNTLALCRAYLSGRP